ncbi:MAG: capsular polysaccharide synthesis protein [Alphaproteobacteria bacterium]|nr:capsular polysaccharide synthesis protein [Alphaproteobacteria bacterium]
MNISRIWALMQIVVRAHVLNWLWRPRAVRSEVRCNVYADVAVRYFKRYLPAVEKVKEVPVINDDNNEKIFTMWQQGEADAPALVKACFRSVRRHCRQELVILDDKNFEQYVNLPQKIIEKYRAGKIRRAHFADIVRVELLYEHGGFWLDSTAFVTQPIPDWIVKQDFFVFMVGNVGQKYSYMQNCFIRARKGAYLLAAWRAMILDYWLHEDSSFDYFMHQVLFKTLVENDDRAKKYFAEMPHIDQDPTHALWHVYKHKPYDEKLFKKLTADAFFQKCSYADAPFPGTFAEAVTKM